MESGALLTVSQTFMHKFQLANVSNCFSKDLVADRIPWDRPADDSLDAAARLLGHPPVLTGNKMSVSHEAHELGLPTP